MLATILLSPRAASATGWELVEPMPTARAYHAGATLAGLWYLTGGEHLVGNGTEYPTDVDVFDPATGRWSQIGELSAGRAYFPAIVDSQQARIFFVGGAFGFTSLSTCDAFGANTVLPMPMLSNARYLHAAAFSAGKVVVSGGWGSPEMRDDAEMFDGAAWRSAGTMPAGARIGHTMTTLADETHVLVAGGCQSDHVMREVDLLDARDGSWSKVANLNVPRCSHTAATLADGRILVAGSITLSSSEAAAEIFDPITGRWTLVTPMREARYNHDMVLLPDGRVLVAGGTNNARDGEFGALNTVEVYDPLADTWTAVPPMHDRRRWPRLAVLSDGVYVAGGDYATGTSPNDVQILDSVERLAWGDLPSRVPMGERPDGAAPDATADAGRDGGDAASDAQDGPTSDRPTDPARPGCSCELVSSRNGGASALAAVAACLWAVGRGCRRRMGRR